MSEDDPELPEDADEPAAETHRGAPKQMHAPLPERWEELRAMVNNRTARNRHDARVPLHKIGRFDAVILRGRGSYGVVFEAIDPDLQRRVALKLCQVHDDETVDDVLAEARHLAKLNHPNVVTIYETGRYDDDVFFVMEYATGGTAESFVNENDPPWQEVLDIYLGAGAGLAAAHEGGIVHGDFKPTNVLVDEGGVRARVADFGFARIRLEHMPEHEREATKARRGTLAYAAPEVLRGEVADALSDQWSFCASFWESLEGVLPFNAHTAPGMLATIDRLEPWSINLSVPTSLREVLERGLSMDRDERYPSMAELLRELEAVRRAAPPPSDEHRLKVTEQPDKRRRRRKGPGWGYSAAIGMLVGGLSVFVAMRFAQGPAPDEPSAIPTGECAVEPGESIDPNLRDALLEVCGKIRDGKFLDATRRWDRVYRPGDAAVAKATLIVARTFIEAAESLQPGDANGARKAAKAAEEWAGMLGDKHPGVDDINDRIKEILGR